MAPATGLLTDIVTKSGEQVETGGTVGGVVGVTVTTIGVRVELIQPFEFVDSA